MLGPTYNSMHTLGVMYGTQAAAANSSVAILGINSVGVKILRPLPALNNASIRVQGSSFLIVGSNFREHDSWHNGNWTFTDTPLRVLISRATQVVKYVEIPYDGNSQLGMITQVIGNTILHMKVGQSLGFEAANAQATSNPTPIYSNLDEPGPIYLGMVNMIPSSVVHFTKPGTYDFVIDGDTNSSTMRPNSLMARVQVVVRN